MTNELIKRADFLHELLNAVPSLLLIVDSDVRIHHANAAAMRELGSGNGAVLMRRGGEVLHCVHASEAPGGCGAAMACRECVLRNSVVETMKEQRICRVCTKLDLVTGDGATPVYFTVTTSPLAYGGNPYVLLVIENITDLKRSEEALRAGEARLRNITSMLGEGVYVVDRDGRLTFMNPEAEKLLGWKEAELLGKNVHDLIHAGKTAGSALSASDCVVLKTASTGAAYRAEEEFFIRKDGARFPAALVSTPLREDGKIAGAVAVFRDTTELTRAAAEWKHLNELLERRATTDALTGVCNRLKFSELLDQAVREVRRYNHPLSLIMFDIDHFKVINDQAGHQAGDCVLRELARLVRENVRAADVFARWGGEEFMILSPHTGLEETRQLAEKLQALIESSRFHGRHRVTCSFGITQCTEQDTVESFTDRADRAMYRAKAGGRNRVEVVDAEP
jgi:diguanylate cyclase (GGDEF)-like protein/PAS domain S-box-containing protein